MKCLLRMMLFAPLSLAAMDAAAEVRQVAMGNLHSCALFDDGRVKCWGESRLGQLGYGDVVRRGSASGQMGAALPYVDLGTNVRATHLALGANHTCAALAGGGVKCWGANGFGQLGLGDTLTRGDVAGQMGDALPMVDLGSGQRAVSVAAGESHSCAVLENGGVKCWGYNATGQLGLDDTAARGDAPGEMGDALPAVSVGATVTRVVAGASHTCALTAQRHVKCWGDGRYGQTGAGVADVLGDAAGEMASLTTVDLGVGRTVIDLFAGFVQTCAHLDDKSVKCWGYNRDGRLGLSDQDHRGDAAGEMGAALASVSIAPGQHVEQLACGLRHCCARLTANTVKCWGLGANGVLGLEDTLSRASNPGLMGHELPFLDFGRLAVVTGIAAGGEHSCATLQGGALKCWGNNRSGQLGIGDTVNRGATPGSMGVALPSVSL
jgi:alpha-tubulin suppressor-like RCC1 family protein